jgi:hypothetical protein
MISYKIAPLSDIRTKFTIAQMAELVDALGSGPSGGNTVEVRVLFWAPLFRTRIPVKLFRGIAFVQNWTVFHLWYQFCVKIIAGSTVGYRIRVDDLYCHADHVT